MLGIWLLFWLCSCQDVTTSTGRLWHRLYMQEGLNFRIKNILRREVGWKKTDDQSEADIIWTRDATGLNWRDFRGNKQWVNRVLNETALTTKGSLADAIHKYQASVENVWVNIPETFFLFDQASCEEMVEQLQREDSHSRWIVKPTHKTGGQGLSIKSASQILSTHTCSKTQGGSTRGGAHYGEIVQRYIHPPLLFKGHKFELRFYALLVCMSDEGEGQWLVLMWPYGEVRVMAKPYNPATHPSTSAFNDPDIHHTVKMNEESRQPDWLVSQSNTQDDTRYLIQQLEADLISRGLIEPASEPGSGWLTADLLPSVAHYLYDSFHAVRKQLISKEGTFALLAMDFMLDQNLNLYLLEFQKNPDLNPSGIRQQIIPPLVKQMGSLLITLRDRKLTATSSTRWTTRDLQWLEILGELKVIVNEAD